MKKFGWFLIVMAGAAEFALVIAANPETLATKLLTALVSLALCCAVGVGVFLVREKRD